MPTDRHLAAVKNSPAERKFLRLPDVIAITGLSRTSIYRLQEKGFPSPVKLTEKSSAWLATEIYRWCEERTAQSRGVDQAA